jgi:serine-type D-Ala-D-Ala carboxypeptidase (penicillin-binding protein 5/6)
MPFFMALRMPAAALAFVAFIGFASPAEAQSIETTARQAIVLDANSGRILMEKDADHRMPTASMSKLATGYMVFEALEDGRITLDTKFPVSEKAWRKQGSKMFVDLGSSVSVSDLLRGVIVQSGNDATIVLAEGLAGTEEAFAEAMTAKMKEIGLNSTNLKNASGWPDPDHYSTPRDLARLAQVIIEKFPEYYEIYSEHDFTYNGITQGNRNPLLYRDMGADGLKTGHTEEAGYGLVASAKRGERRVIAVLSGMSSMQERADESAKLIEWAFANFDTYQLYEPGAVVHSAPVWLGQKAEVPMVLEQAVHLTLSRTEEAKFEKYIELTQPVPAPIRKGDQVGTLVVDAPGLAERRYPLVAGEDVGSLDFMGRVQAALTHIVFGSNRL